MERTRCVPLSSTLVGSLGAMERVHGGEGGGVKVGDYQSHIL